MCGISYCESDSPPGAEQDKQVRLFQDDLNFQLSFKRKKEIKPKKVAWN